MLPLHCEQLQSLHASSVQEVQPWVHPAALPLFASPAHPPAVASPATRGHAAVGLGPLALPHLGEAAHAVIEIRPEELLGGWPGVPHSSVAPAPHTHAPHTRASGTPVAAPAAPHYSPIHTGGTPALLLPGTSHLPPARHLQRQHAFREHSSDMAPPVGRLHSISSARLVQPSGVAAAAAAAAAALGPFGVADAASSRRSSSSSSASLSSRSSSSSSGGAGGGFSRMVAALRLGGMARLAGHLAGLRDVPSDFSPGGASRGFVGSSSRRARRNRLRAEAFLELETYDDLLALDQFNVKRGVKLVAVQQLPARFAGGCCHCQGCSSSSADGPAASTAATAATMAGHCGMGRQSRGDSSSTSSISSNDAITAGGVQGCTCAAAGCEGDGARGGGGAGSPSSRSSGTAALQEPQHSCCSHDVCRLSDQQQHLRHHRHHQQHKEACEERCHICMEQYADMAPNKAVVVLPCGHEYCRSCLWGWLRDHVTCPVCRWRFPDVDTHLLP